MMDSFVWYVHIAYATHPLVISVTGLTVVIAIHYYKCSILLLVIAVSLLLCQIYKLNFNKGMYTQGSVPPVISGIPTEGLGMYPPKIRDYYVQNFASTLQRLTKIQ